MRLGYTLVKLGIVPLARPPHFPQDLQPTLAQTAQGARMALPFLAFLVVVRIGPRTRVPTQVGPQVHRVP